MRIRSLCKRAASILALFVLLVLTWIGLFLALTLLFMTVLAALYYAQYLLGAC